MGTNYYLMEKTPCECCGRPFERLHIGKSSMGWCFSLHIDPELGINDLPDWIEQWSKPGTLIISEYGETVTIKEMMETVTARHFPKNWNEKPHGYNSWEHFDRYNHGRSGDSNGLLRHELGTYCTKHGDGTWDCCPGEFS